MTVTQKVINTILFLAAIPLLRFATNLMLLQMENSFKRKNPNAMTFFRNYKKIVSFIVNYVVSGILLFVVFSIWLFN